LNDPVRRLPARPTILFTAAVSVASVDMPSFFGPTHVNFTRCVVHKLHAMYSSVKACPRWAHPAPQRVLAVYLSGSGEIIACDGEVRSGAGNSTPR
jgi:hypothetical protein